jgi:hypothetical protein
VRLDARSGAIARWLYRDPSRPVEKMARGEGFPLTGREVILTPPLTEAQMRALKVGDVVLLRGEERAAGGFAWRGAVPLRARDAEGRRAMEGESRRPDYQQSRRAL